MVTMASRRWRSIADPPEKSGNVLLACTIHGIPAVLWGFCRVYSDGRARFTEDIQRGRGVAITHWMPLPEHPCVRVGD